MPKAKKHKGSSLVKDFDKQKTKLGKGKKPAATNATNTSFKARSIALTQQSITKDRSSAPTSKRNLTADELIGQTRHYSASVRRDALTGLKEIYSAHKYLVLRHIGLVLPNTSRLVSDEDAGVRNALHTFLKFYLASVPASSLEPYASTLLLYTTSAMSHIYPDVRLDAVRMLDLLYPSLGPLVSSGWEAALGLDTKSETNEMETMQGHGERVLRCYLSLLGIAMNFDSSVSTTSSQLISSDLAPGARLLILRSMLSFFEQTSIQKYNANTEFSCPTWFWDSCFTSIPELDAFKMSWTSYTGEIAPPLNIFEIDETCVALSDLESNVGKSWGSLQIAQALDNLAQVNETAMSNGSASIDGGSNRRNFFQSISPLLISVFLDAAPTAFAPSVQPGSSSVPAQLVSIIVSLTLCLWRGTTHCDSSARNGLSKLLSHVSIYFPFGNNWEDGARAEMVSLNLAYCELVGLLAVTEDNKKKGKEEASTAKQLYHVSEFIVELLNEESRQDRVRQPILRGKTFIDLLPTMWLLLNGKDPRNCLTILDALLLHWHALKASDPTKCLGAEFLGRLWLLPLQRSYCGSFTIRPGSPHRSCLVAWLTQSVPRYLWELHGKDSRTNAMLLSIARIVACQSDGLIIKDKELENLGKLLTPFFQVRHATKGPISGPYTRLPPTVQRMARGLLSVLPSLDLGLQRAAFAVGALTTIQE